jgi:hypothetical protein
MKKSLLAKSYYPMIFGGGFLFIIATSCGSPQNTSGVSQTGTALSASQIQGSGALGNYAATYIRYRANNTGGWITQADWDTPVSISILMPPSDAQVSPTTAFMSLDILGTDLGFYGVSAKAVSSPAQGGNGTTYQFTSAIQNTGLSPIGSFAIQAHVTLTSGNQFDPTQSWVDILDCGLSKFKCDPGSLVESGIIVNFVKR